jgi:hypothetical protein
MSRQTMRTATTAVMTVMKRKKRSHHRSDLRYSTLLIHVPSPGEGVPFAYEEDGSILVHMLIQ